MLKIFKNDWDRLMIEKAYLIISISLTTLAIVAAIFLTNKVEVKGKIVIVNETQNALPSFDSPYFKVTVQNQEPPFSSLVKNQYDAFVIINQDGSNEIKTIKNDTFKMELEAYLNNTSNYHPIVDTSRKVGTNIMGYMLMFLFMQSVLYARFFADDKEKHMIERIAIAPIPFGKYLAGHGLFLVCLTFTPAFLVVSVASVLGISVGFAIWQYAFLIGIFALLASGFSLMINSFICSADTANMLASAITILSTILAGAFISFTKGNALLEKALYLLPQKDFIAFTNSWEKGNITGKSELELLYVIVLSVVFLGVAVIKTKRDYVYK